MALGDVVGALDIRLTPLPVNAVQSDEPGRHRSPTSPGATVGQVTTRWWPETAGNGGASHAASLQGFSH